MRIHIQDRNILSSLACSHKNTFYPLYFLHNRIENEKSFTLFNFIHDDYSNPPKTIMLMVTVMSDDENSDNEMNFWDDFCACISNSCKSGMVMR